MNETREPPWKRGSDGYWYWGRTLDEVLAEQEAKRQEREAERASLAASYRHIAEMLAPLAEASGAGAETRRRTALRRLARMTGDRSELEAFEAEAQARHDARG